MAKELIDHTLACNLYRQTRMMHIARQAARVISHAREITTTKRAVLDLTERCEDSLVLWLAQPENRERTKTFAKNMDALVRVSEWVTDETKGLFADLLDKLYKTDPYGIEALAKEN